MQPARLGRQPNLRLWIAGPQDADPGDGAGVSIRVVHALLGPSQSHNPTVIDASTSPAANAPQKLKPSRPAHASGTKKGRPSGTSTSVSRATCEIARRSCFDCHVETKATMLITGR